MPQSSWDNGGAPAPRKGMSFWGKLALGCGGAMLCFVLALGALVGWGLRKANKAMDSGWAELHREVASLRTEAGTRELYRANPALAQEYPTEADFLQAAALWRPRLGEVPAQRPALKELFEAQNGVSFSFQTRYRDGRKLQAMQLRMSTGATLVVEREGDQLTDIRVD